MRPADGGGPRFFHCLHISVRHLWTQDGRAFPPPRLGLAPPAVIHLLLIAEDPAVIPPLAAPGTPVDFKILRKADLAAARPLLAAGLFDVALLVVERLSSAASRAVAEFRECAPACPLAVAAADGVPADREAAYLAGADVVLVAPADPAALAALLRRLAARTGPPAPPAPVPPAVPAAGATPPFSALAVMRDFSQVLSYSLDYREFTRHFALKLREVIGAARVVIFLEAPPAAGSLGPDAAANDSRLVCAGAVGLPADLTDHFELSRDRGLGRSVFQTGRILRLGAESTAPFLAGDSRLQREFEILGCEIALPVNDRERTIGVALLGGRLTGAPFTDAELLLVCHLMEELGLAVKNSWLHHQLSASHHLFGDVLSAMTSGALVVGPDLTVLFANPVLLRLLHGEAPSAAARLACAELPAPLGASLRAVAERGESVAPFLYEHPGTPPQVFRVSLVPFPPRGRALPQPVLLLLENFTSVRAAQRAEIEASNLKLIGLIAKRFAHEIRNSLVPLTTHQQLFDTDYANTEFRDSLKAALGRETGRIQRFTEQMLFLAQTEGGATDALPLEDLLRRSFEHSQAFLGRAGGELEIRSEVQHPFVRCHRPSLLHALQEIFLNGLQSAGDPPRVTVSVVSEAGPEGRPGLAVRVHDNGRGFTPEVAARAVDPFFTTRNTGVGLGLTVAKRVIEAHAGRLEVQARRGPDDPDLVIHLPAG
jgi:signal transduction histidine kinase/DNA-binding response OmpR family regulator